MRHSERVGEADAPGQSAAAGQSRTVFYRGRRLGSREFSRIQRLIAERPELSREALAREVARRFQWRQLNGQWAVNSCRLLLGRLARRGWLTLPPPRRAGNYAKPAGAEAQASAPAGARVVSASPAPLLVRPLARPEYRRWRQDMARYHYLGAGPLVGE